MEYQHYSQSQILMALSLLATIITNLFFFFAATTTSPEHLIATLKSKNITSVHLPSPTPEIISSFSNSNISLLVTIPNSLIPNISSDPSATSAWLSSHVTPFLPQVRICAISLGDDVMDYNVLKLVLPAVDNVKEKVKEFGIKETIKVSTMIRLRYVNCSNTDFQALLGGLSEKNVTLFVNLKPWDDVSLGSLEWYKEVVCGDYVLRNNDVSYQSLENGEIMDYGVVETRVSKSEEKVKKDEADRVVSLLLICAIILVLFNLTIM